MIRSRTRSRILEIQRKSGWPTRDFKSFFTWKVRDGPDDLLFRFSLMPFHEIVDAVAHDDHTVTVTWADGVSGVVDFLPIIDRGGWFTPLRDADYFVNNMILLPSGIGLTWPEEIDYSADGLRREAFPNGLA